MLHLEGPWALRADLGVLRAPFVWGPRKGLLQMGWLSDTPICYGAATLGVAGQGIGCSVCGVPTHSLGKGTPSLVVRVYGLTSHVWEWVALTSLRP